MEVWNIPQVKLTIIPMKNLAKGIEPGNDVFLYCALNLRTKNVPTTGHASGVCTDVVLLLNVPKERRPTPGQINPMNLAISVALIPT